MYLLVIIITFPHRKCPGEKGAWPPNPQSQNRQNLKRKPPKKEKKKN
jgi:hypothetical protein